MFVYSSYVKKTKNSKGFQVFQKNNPNQQLGIACLRASALGWLTAKVLYNGAGPSETHPAAYDRLSDLLTSYNPHDQTEVNGYAQTILMLQLDSSGQKVSADRLQGTVAENIQYLIDLISQTGENQ